MDINPIITSRAAHPTQLQGRLKTLVQVTWLLMTALALSSYVMGIPLRYRSLITPLSESDMMSIFGLPPSLEASVTARLSSQEINEMEDLGFSKELYAGYLLAFDFSLVLTGTIVAILIFWRKTQDWVALWFSFITLLLGTNGTSLVVPSLVYVWPGWILISTLFGFFGMTSNVHILFIAPDGRYVPAWTRVLSATFNGIMLAVVTHTLLKLLNGEILLGFLILTLISPIWFVLLGIGIYAQVYRYLRISDSIQRQQSKWIAVGLAAVAVGFGLNVVLVFLVGTHFGLQRVALNLVRAPLVNGCMLFLPICLAIAIFRYRLWDIDLIIRRTLVYSLLSGLLGALYYSGVVVLQSILPIDPSQPSPVVIVVTTLMIAALFNPLRHRIQEFIDRRFYRRRYDVEKALASFAATARSEADLGRLSTRLMGTVQETLQPAQVSLWMAEAVNKYSSSIQGQPGMMREPGIAGKE